MSPSAPWRRWAAEHAGRPPRRHRRPPTLRSSGRAPRRMAGSAPHLGRPSLPAPCSRLAPLGPRPSRRARRESWRASRCPRTRSAPPPRRTACSPPQSPQPHSLRPGQNHTVPSSPQTRQSRRRGRRRRAARAGRHPRPHPRTRRRPDRRRPCPGLPLGATSAERQLGGRSDAALGERRARGASGHVLAVHACTHTLGVCLQGQRASERAIADSCRSDGRKQELFITCETVS